MHITFTAGERDSKAIRNVIVYISLVTASLQLNNSKMDPVTR